MNDYLIFRAARTGIIRTNEQGHLIVPTIALTEGVIRAVNAPCAEFVPISVLAHRPERWSGCPVVLNHPQKNGVQISANDPRVLAAQGFGVISNPRIEGRKLAMDLCLDPDRAAQVGATHVIDKLRSGRVCEISIGAFVTTSTEGGVHQSKRYDATWQSLIPDHIALVEKGACDIATGGCGAGRAAGRTFDKRAEDTPPDSYAIAIEQRNGLKPVCPFDDESYDVHGRPPDGYQIQIDRLRKQQGESK
jgi:hypothetical protein